MKKVIQTTAIAVLAITIAAVVYSCKKTHDNTPTAADDTAVQTQNASDDARVNNELENVTNDANLSVSSSSTISGRLSGASNFLSLPCDLRLDSNVNGNIKAGKIILYYDTNTCSGIYKRWGSVTVQTHGKWITAGSTITLTFNNYTVYNLTTYKTFVFNGTKTITNISGKLLSDLLTNSSDTIVHKIRANNLSITFDNGTTRTWSVNRTKKYTSPYRDVYQIAVSSDSANVVMWGTTRGGNAFTDNITSPIISNSSCGWYQPTGGIRVISVSSYGSLMITFGVNAAGAQVGTYPTNGCSLYYGYKLNWANASGVSRQLIVPYY